MKITIALPDSSLSSNMWYHGSPYGNIDFKLDRITFFTHDKKVAEQFAYNKPFNTGKRLSDQAILDPTVYQVELNLKRTFDMRKQWHEYETRREAATKGVFRDNLIFTGDDGKRDWLPKLDSEGFIMRSGLPGYGRIAQFKVFLPDYDSMYVDEGTHGISLAVFDPRKKVSIIQKVEL